MKLTLEQSDRARGVLVATAAGDALGAGYEFGPPLPDGAPVDMIGGGPFGFEPGEWTDDTSMAVAIAEAAATGADLREATTRGAVLARWQEWAASAKDVGRQTRRVLRAAARGDASAAAEAARSLHRATGRTGGNGALMRTAPVSLAYLDDPEGLVAAATGLSAMTHFDPESGEACVIWCLAIRHAVLTGDLDVRHGITALPGPRRSVWSERIDVAEASHPTAFPNNGWVVAALQAAWCAIATSPGMHDDRARPAHLRNSLERAVRGGYDTDTVAAIAGGLLGAAHGAGAVPAMWTAALHGWPGLDAAGLTRLADAIVDPARRVDGRG